VVLRGALIVGAGEMIYQFTGLVAATGVIGEALGLLKDVAAEARERIALRAGAAWARVEAGWAAAQATILEGLQGATEAVVGLGRMNVHFGSRLAIRHTQGDGPVWAGCGPKADHGIRLFKSPSLRKADARGGRSIRDTGPRLAASCGLRQCPVHSYDLSGLPLSSGRHRITLLGSRRCPIGRANRFQRLS
jgi:hypothetical protein